LKTIILMPFKFGNQLGKKSPRTSFRALSGLTSLLTSKGFSSLLSYLSPRVRLCIG
jgi:hypothetical protein